jgi:hypothetical protein
MVDGYLSGNNAKGTRGLIGIGVDAVAIAAYKILIPQPWNTGPIYPQSYRDGMGVKYVLRF